MPLHTRPYYRHTDRLWVDRVKLQHHQTAEQRNHRKDNCWFQN